ncbi:hypothetical protein G7L40_02225 [Paenibacillus polymyxa]|uniref:Uncharacterized protein n=1 Tax=Paenibacillus polymyxa TaxID=1406 RepID=A0A378XVY2_PAEPO|nr:hypothetical protein [Paenibacillus polymyxa]MBE7897520.1 hypothetical protein [Paenibacillus polymyxa]MBG9766200.1 hypothetical protein [Paenibacillus polymyxa]MCC3257230.1 hypothetical protein [Paenibacillus polymyxa]QPK51642.1 hypothetical protein G7035_02220 [Paenibacillus polymyxa]QPK56730.1 hypothetical protein G7L40_02225 [Paenibacillus polymyxa]
MIIRCGEYEHEGTPQELIEYERLNDDHSTDKDIRVSTHVVATNLIKLYIEVKEPCTVQDIKAKLASELDKSLSKYFELK